MQKPVHTYGFGLRAQVAAAGWPQGGLWARLRTQWFWMVPTTPVQGTAGSVSGADGAPLRITEERAECSSSSPQTSTQFFPIVSFIQAQ